ncbi:hypothetical protein EVAR_50212_1 [Eumeta japonica]|uniref:Uncharacterized protein n=1 Tax=Eumeta variegata TaxID=151549 RepID=A0A4C1WW93_EUMVA|nr:hypothetical protein EVAR_50212_1 [Eumeta japonica]
MEKAVESHVLLSRFYADALQPIEKRTFVCFVRVSSESGVKRGMHVMYPERPAQYRSSQHQSSQQHQQQQPECRPASPSRHQPAKKRRVLSPQPPPAHRHPPPQPHPAHRPANDYADKMSWTTRAVKRHYTYGDRCTIVGNMKSDRVCPVLNYKADDFLEADRTVRLPFHNRTVSTRKRTSARRLPNRIVCRPYLVSVEMCARTSAHLPDTTANKVPNN